MTLLHTFVHFFHPQRSNNHRPRLLHPQVIGAMVAVLSISAIAFKPLKLVLNSTGNILGYASDITAGQVIAATNTERAKAGLPELVANDKLNQAALAKAQHMLDNQYWAHVAPDGTQPWTFFKNAQYSYRLAGENLARDFGHSSDMMTAWMASPTHRANLMNGKYQEIGIAVIDGTLLGSQTTLVVQLFATPQAGVSQLPTENGVESIELAEAPEQVRQVKTAVDNALSDFRGKSPAQPAVLGIGLFQLSNWKQAPILSPLQVGKLFFLAIIFVIVLTLVYDGVIMHNRNTVRLVGKNLAHIMLLLMVAFLLIFFKGGVIG